jgi:hypothetical protein
MSKVAAYADIQARLTGVAYPIKWPNTPFTLPVDAGGDPTPYYIVEIMGGASEPIELGGGIWQNVGMTWVHMLVPVNSGADAAFAMADDIIARFRSPPLEPVVYLEISDDPGDPGDDNGNYWRTSISASWRLQTYVQRS